MQPDWLKRKKEIPSDIASLISTSRVNGCWIFFEPSKAFYTPDEFEEKWTKYYSSTNRSSNFKDFKIVNPLYAVRLASQWIDIANVRQKEIIEKLAKYLAKFKLKNEKA